MILRILNDLTTLLQALYDNFCLYLILRFPFTDKRNNVITQSNVKFYDKKKKTPVSIWLICTSLLPKWWCWLTSGLIFMLDKKTNKKSHRKVRMPFPFIQSASCQPLPFLFELVYTRKLRQEKRINGVDKNWPRVMVFSWGVAGGGLTRPQRRGSVRG